MHRPPAGAYIAASPALLSLRRGAVVSSFIVAVAIIAQTLAFACVHFTDIRFAAASSPVKDQLTVVNAPPPRAIDPAKFDERVVETRPLGKGDSTLAWVSGLASGVGVIALVVLVAQCWMATAIVAGAGVIGMHRAVRAATFATALLGAAVPWSSALPAWPVFGLFCGYQPLVLASAAVANGTRGELSVISVHAVLPLLLLAALVWIAFNLSVGVAAGILSTAVDPVVEAEIAAVQQHGAGSLYTARSSGDLNRAIAPPVLATPMRIAGDNEADRAIAELEKLAGRRRPTDEPLRPTGTDPLRRPI